MIINLKNIVRKQKRKLPRRLPVTTYPKGLEAEMQRIVLNQMTDMEISYRELVRPYLQLSGRVYGKGILDSAEEKINFWNKFAAWKSAVDEIVSNPEYQNLIAKIYKKLSTRNANDLNKKVKKIVGIEPYGQEPWIDRQINQQVKKHVALIKNVGEQIKTDIETIVRRNASQGMSRTRMIEEIEQGLQGAKGRFKTVRTRAKLIARTETANFYATVNQTRFTEAGLETFVWQSVEDSRVRPRHRELHGQVFKFDDPALPEGGPGGSPNCRCIAEINLEEINKGVSDD